MIFNKKKRRMVDVRELQKRGVVRIPRKEISIPTTSEGFIELGQTTKTQEPETNSQENANFFGFMDNSESDSPQPQTFATESDGYNKREVDAKITNLDNKIYKLEQRLELLEKKLDVNQPTNNVGAMGW
jgi:hypothetical protein